MLLHKLLVAAGIAGFAASGPAEVGVVYKFDFTRKLVSGGSVTRKFTLDINTMGVSDGVSSTPIGPYFAPVTTFGIFVSFLKSASYNVIVDLDMSGSSGDLDLNFQAAPGPYPPLVPAV